MKPPRTVDFMATSYGSAVMSRVRGKDTKPEMKVRRLVHSLGYRYRLHRLDLPGRPDLTLTRFGCVIFVHGCFWHGHRCSKGDRLPKTNVDFWRRKIEGNHTRDQRTLRKLHNLGWRTLVLWECQLGNPDRLAARIISFLLKMEA